MPAHRYLLPPLLVVAALAGCSKSKNTVSGGGPSGGQAVAADLRVIDPAATIDPAFAPNVLQKAFGKPPEVMQLEFTADGRRLLVCSGQAANGAQVWTVGGGPPTRVREWQTDWGVLSPDGRRIALVPAGKSEAIIAEVDSGSVIAPLHSSSVRAWLFSSPELLIYTPSNSGGGVKGTTRLASVDGATGARRSEIVLHEGTTQMQRSGLFGDRKQVAVVHHKEDLIDIWDLTTGKRVRQVPAAGPTPGLDWYELFASADGRRFASSRGKGLLVWDGNLGQVVAQVPDQPFVKAGAFIPGRELFVLPPAKPLRAGAANDVAAFDLQSQAYVAAFAGLPGSVSTVAVSPDGKWLAAGDKSGQVRLWDLGQLP
jgi:WD40 repeat protein